MLVILQPTVDTGYAYTNGLLNNPPSPIRQPYAVIKNHKARTAGIKIDFRLVYAYG